MKMYEKLTATLTGVAPLLMHNGQLADPLNKFTKALKEVTSKRIKTDKDHEEMSRLEWLGSLYIGEDGSPCIPGDLIEAWAKTGAKKSKLGKQFAAGVFCDQASFKLRYDGLRDPDAMWASGKFADRRPVKVGTARVLRTRPIFRHWSLTVELLYSPDVITEAQLTKSIIDAGIWGLGDYRPRFGRCTVTV